MTIHGNTFNYAYKVNVSSFELIVRTCRQI